MGKGSSNAIEVNGILDYVVGIKGIFSWSKTIDSSNIEKGLELTFPKGSESYYEYYPKSIGKLVTWVGNSRGQPSIIGSCRRFPFLSKFELFGFQFLQANTSSFQDLSIKGKSETL